MLSDSLFIEICPYGVALPHTARDKADVLRGLMTDKATVYHACGFTIYSPSNCLFELIQFNRKEFASCHRKVYICDIFCDLFGFCLKLI